MDAIVPTAEAPPPPPPPPPTGWFRRKYGLGLPLALLALLGLLVLGLDSPIGHRLLADWLESSESDIGLSVSVGRIEGSIYGTVQLQDVGLRDPDGVFARVPVVELAWNPLAWLDNTLDIRRAVLRRGVLLRVPHFRSPPMQGSILPDFDVRVDRFAIERLTVSRAVLGAERKVDLQARAEVRPRRAFLAVQGRLGGGDRLSGLLDDDRARNRFALGLDYAAPRGGLLAALTGADGDRHLRIGGAGDAHVWHGGLVADARGRRAAAVRLTRREGRFDLAGLVWPMVWSGPQADPAASRLLADRFALTGHAGLEARRLSGTLRADSATLRLSVGGEADLGAGVAHRLAVQAETRAPLPLGKGGILEGARGQVVFDGPFASVSATTSASATRWVRGAQRVEGFTARGEGRRDAQGWRLPFTLAASRVTTGQSMLDARLVGTGLGGTGLGGARVRGTARLAGSRLTIADLALTSPALSGKLALDGDVAAGRYGLSGHLVSRGWLLDDMGRADGEATLALGWNRGTWRLGAHLAGGLDGITNPAVQRLAGPRLSVSAEASMGAGQQLALSRIALNSEHLGFAATGHGNPDGSAEFSGSGHHGTLGSFTLNARLGSDGPHATLALPDPYPTGGVKAVTLSLAPGPQGLAVEAQGQSLFGPFGGTLAYVRGAAGAPGRVEVDHFTIWKTMLTGALSLPSAGPSGSLALQGGGVSGSLRLTPRSVGQGVDLSLAMRDAHFGGDKPLTIARGTLNASGVLLKAHTTLDGTLEAQGIGIGRLFLGQVAASAKLIDGNGPIAASLAGRRGSRFELQLGGEIAPGRVSVGGRGLFAGQAIAMPRRAVFLTRPEAEGGGWRMEPSQIDFGTGRAIASGVFGNGAQQLDLALANMPLALGDVVFADLGLGGTASGLLHLQRPREGLPGGEVRLMLHNLTRSGLVVTSRPIDLALVGRLGADRLETRAVASEGGHAIGRLQARVAGLPGTGGLADRLRAGALQAQMRFEGPADAPWRLMGVDDFDLTGPIAIAADVTGSLDAPLIRGSLASDGLRLQSADTGTDISHITARGSFAGSHLRFATLAGQTAGGGQVAGSGSIDFTGITEGHRPALDLALATRKAQLAARADLGLTVTGPMRIISDGLTGHIAGRLAIDSAQWRLGLGQAAQDLPQIATREVNRSADVAPASARRVTWRFLVDLAAASKVRLTGLGLDSEWSANLRLRGPLREPTLDGHAELIGGTYEFSGVRFDLTRGRIIFTDSTSPDPRLDIAATANVTGLAATVNVHGTSLRPLISFTSVPNLPEEEVLSRLLFGDSINKISAPEAAQLGVALATLHGGGGLDPVNKLRKVIGLDRLRIVAPDPTIGRQTAVAAGKYFARRFYAEVVSDGHGYSATDIEYRVSRWLSLLGTISTVGQQSVNARASKDY